MGYDDESDNTWEPLANLHACQELVSDFEMAEAELGGPLVDADAFRLRSARRYTALLSLLLCIGRATPPPAKGGAVSARAARRGGLVRGGDGARPSSEPD